MTLIWAIIIGFIVGLVARAIFPGKDPAGFILTSILGIVGALLGTTIGRALGFYEQSQGAGFIMSVIGALILLFVFSGVFRKRVNA